MKVKMQVKTQSQPKNVKHEIQPMTFESGLRLLSLVRTHTPLLSRY